MWWELIAFAVSAGFVSGVWPERHMLYLLWVLVANLVVLRYEVSAQFKKHDEDLRSEVVKLRKVAEQILGRKEG